MTSNPFIRLHAWTTRRTRDRRGTAAVEFAFILPLLVALYLGSVETTFAIIADRKVTNLTSTMADLVAQTKTVNNAEMSNIFKASAPIMQPYSTATLNMIITQVEVDSGGVSTVQWSEAGPYGGTAYTNGVPFELPAGLDVADTCVIVAEVTYAYSSFLTYFIGGTINLSDTFYLRPRTTQCVTKV